MLNEHQFSDFSNYPVSRLYGRGIEALGSGDRVLTPWPSAGRLKHRAPFDQDIVNEGVRSGQLSDVDPRMLHANQGWLTRAGVSHYMEHPDELYADKHQAGNQHPVIYTRRTSGLDSPPQHIILSGHHRAAAALLQGRPLRAIHVEGGWGAQR